MLLLSSKESLQLFNKTDSVPYFHLVKFLMLNEAVEVVFAFQLLKEPVVVVQD
jgi:hypothetical protein